MRKRIGIFLVCIMLVTSFIMVIFPGVDYPLRYKETSKSKEIQKSINKNIEKMK